MGNTIKTSQLPQATSQVGPKPSKKPPFLPSENQIEKEKNQGSDRKTQEESALLTANAEQPKNRFRRYNEAKLQNDLLVTGGAKRKKKKPKHKNLIIHYRELLAYFRECMKTAKTAQKDEETRLKKEYENITKKLADNSIDGAKIHHKAKRIAEISGVALLAIAAGSAGKVGIQAEGKLMGDLFSFHGMLQKAHELDNILRAGHGFDAGKAAYDALVGEESKYNEVKNTEFMGKQNIAQNAKDAIPNEKQKTGATEDELAKNVHRFFDELLRVLVRQTG